MSELYLAQPKNPVDFLGKWLLNYTQIEKTALTLLEQQEKTKELREKSDKEKTEMKKKEDALVSQEAEKEEKIKSFYQKLEKSKDLNDQLQDLVDFLQEHTGATATYVGKLVMPKKKIEDGDNDTAHIEEGAANIIHFLNASQDHKFLIDKTLTQE